MYEINCSYTGYFGLPFPFTFTDKAQAEKCCEVLNNLRNTLPEWSGLKEFKVFSSITGTWTAANPEQEQSRLERIK